jgi:hypothetical protein
VLKPAPYKTSGTGVYNPATGDYGGNGTGTHVGAHTFQGNVSTTPTAHPLIFDFVIPCWGATAWGHGDTGTQHLLTAGGSLGNLPA